MKKQIGARSELVRLTAEIDRILQTPLGHVAERFGYAGVPKNDFADFLLAESLLHDLKRRRDEVAKYVKEKSFGQGDD